MKTKIKESLSIRIYYLTVNSYLFLNSQSNFEDIFKICFICFGNDGDFDFRGLDCGGLRYGRRHARPSLLPNTTDAHAHHPDSARILDFARRNYHILRIYFGCGGHRVLINDATASRYGGSRHDRCRGDDFPDIHVGGHGRHGGARLIDDMVFVGGT